MSEQIEHIDPYGQRYVTITDQVTNGLQVTTEIYTPYVYGKPIETRRIQNADGSSSIEVFGIITNIIQTMAKNGNVVTIIAEGCTSETSWIEVWRNCLAPPVNRFAYTMDCCIVGTVQTAVTVGPAFVDPVTDTSPANSVVWADLTPAGVPIPPPSDTGFEFIDVWS